MAIVWNGPNGEVPIWYAPRDELERNLKEILTEGHHFFTSVSDTRYQAIMAIKSELGRRDKIWETYNANTQG